MRSAPRRRLGRAAGSGVRDAEANTFGLRIFNPDGSEAEKSGNGIRIFARWLVSTGRAATSRFSIQTLGGRCRSKSRATSSPPTWASRAFATTCVYLDLEAERLDVVALDIGNPHCVIFAIELDITSCAGWGRWSSSTRRFRIGPTSSLRASSTAAACELLIWERGAGETQASGSSACAVVAAAHHLGQVDQVVTAAMPGGELAHPHRPRPARLDARPGRGNRPHHPQPTADRPPADVARSFERVDRGRAERRCWNNTSTSQQIDERFARIESGWARIEAHLSGPDRN